MTTATALKLGPADHGRALSLEEFLGSDYEGGYQYELVDGRLYVSPVPNPSQESLEQWLFDQLKEYVRTHPEVINRVSMRSRVVIPGASDPSAPEPDLAAFHNYPSFEARATLRWDQVSPILVCEVISENDPEKDLSRNVELYLRVESIREYWILDNREDPLRPSMLVYRRRGRRWQKVIEVPPGATYTTKLLPDFSLTLSPQ